MLGRYAKTGVLVAAVVVLLAEGFLVYRWYDRYHGPDVAASDGGGASEAAPRNAPAPSGDAKKGDAPPDAAFVHRAADANSRGDYTYLADPRIDGDPDAVVLAEPSGPYGRNIGACTSPPRRGGRSST